MLTVAEGVVLGACVIDAHPAMRRNVIPIKVELMKLVFMVSTFLIGFYRVIFLVVSHAFATPMRECL
jgi:hypothetical protein